MEISQFIGFSELSGMEDPCFISQWPFNSYDDQLNMEAVAYGDNTLNRYANATPAFDHYKPIMEPSPRPAKQLKNSSWNSCISSMTNQNTHYASHPSVVNPKEEGTASSKTIIGFTSDTSPASHVQLGTQNHHSGGRGRAKMMDATKFTTPQDHILAERKRREKLSQRFIALSALVPGLKKKDKASILGDAIKHLASLHEKVKTLEEQTIKRSNIESVVLMKRYEVFDDGGKMSSSDGSLHEQLPEIDARFSGRDVLIRVHCEKKTGLVEDILAEIQKQHLSVVNTTAMTFANCALDVTVVAQMDQQFTMTMKDLVKNLHTAFKRFM